MNDNKHIEKCENRIFESNLREFVGKPFNTNGVTMILCKSGYAILSIDFKHQPFSKGNIAIVPNLMSLIPISISSRFQAIVISVTSANCEEMECKITDNHFWDYLVAHPILRTNKEQYQLLCNWFALMKHVIDKCNNELRDNIISGYIYTFFLMLQSEVRPYISQVEETNIIKGHAMNLLNNFNSLVVRYHRKHREVAYYAGLLAVTPDYLNRLVVTHWKGSAKEFISRQTIMTIKDYLYSTDLSIKCIAANLDYDDPSYMCRFFKKVTGMTPAEFRDKKRYNKLTI